MKVIYTYQDLEKHLGNEKELMEYIYKVINSYQSDQDYKDAYAGDAYLRGENLTISDYQKFLYKASGELVPDNMSANYKCKSRYFTRFVMQEASYVVGNGVFFNNDATKARLGGDDLDPALFKAVLDAVAEGASYGFFNYDHIDFFKKKEFIPFYDEETGIIPAGVRFWQLDKNKPIRADLYEVDGMTSFSKGANKEAEVIAKKHDYKLVNGSNAGNYVVLPIIPLYGNSFKQSALVGIREDIDCYDFIKSGMANDIDEASMFYWALENTGGLSEGEALKFVDRVKRLHIADFDGEEGSKATAHTMEVPYQGREAYLQRLRNDLYRDSMSLDVETIAAGAVTATQIKAAYEPLNEKADDLIMCLCEFFQGILALAEIEDSPSFKPSMISNDTETTQNVLAAAAYLDKRTILRKLPFISDDEIDEIMNELDKEEQSRFESVLQAQQAPDEDEEQEGEVNEDNTD